MEVCPRRAHQENSIEGKNEARDSNDSNFASGAAKKGARRGEKSKETPHPGDYPERDGSGGRV